MVVGVLLVGTGVAPDTSRPSLAFPVLETDSVERLAPYHAPDWGEEGVYHNGIDLVVAENVTIVAPCDGVVASVSEHENPYAGNTLFEVSITVDMLWQVKLVLEPGFADQVGNAAQRAAIDVQAGEAVSTGDRVALLLYCEGYPHLHYMVLYRMTDVSPYDVSSPEARAVFETIAERSNSTIQYPCDFPAVTDTPMFRVYVAAGCSLFIGAIIILCRSRR